METAVLQGSGWYLFGKDRKKKQLGIYSEEQNKTKTK